MIACKPEKCPLGEGLAATIGGAPAWDADATLCPQPPQNVVSLVRLTPHFAQNIVISQYSALAEHYLLRTILFGPPSEIYRKTRRKFFDRQQKVMSKHLAWNASHNGYALRDSATI
jgi:hypothetical protein